MLAFALGFPEPDDVRLEVGLDIPWEPDYADANSTKRKAIREDLKRDLVRKNPRLKNYDENKVELILRSVPLS